MFARLRERVLQATTGPQSPGSLDQIDALDAMFMPYDFTPRADRRDASRPCYAEDFMMRADRRDASQLTTNPASDIITLTRAQHRKLLDDAAVGRKIRDILETAAHHCMSTPGQTIPPDCRITAETIVQELLVPSSATAPAPYHVVVMKRANHEAYCRLQRLPFFLGGRDWLRPLRTSLSTLALSTRGLEMRFQSPDLLSGIHQQCALERIAFEADYLVDGNDAGLDSDAGSDADLDTESAPTASAAQTLADLSEQAEILAGRLVAVQQLAADGVIPFCRHALVVPDPDRIPDSFSLENVAAGLTVYDVLRSVLRHSPPSDNDAVNLWYACDKDVRDILGPCPPAKSAIPVPKHIRRMLLNWIQHAGIPVFQHEMLLRATNELYAATIQQNYYKEVPCGCASRPGRRSSHQHHRLPTIQQPPSSPPAPQEPVVFYQSTRRMPPQTQPQKQTPTQTEPVYTPYRPPPTSTTAPSTTSSRTTPSSTWMRNTGHAATQSDLHPQRPGPSRTTPRRPSPTRNPARTPTSSSPTRPTIIRPTPVRPSTTQPTTSRRGSPPRTSTQISPLLSPMCSPTPSLSPLSGTSSQASAKRNSSRESPRPSRPQWR